VSWRLLAAALLVANLAALAWTLQPAEQEPAPGRAAAMGPDAPRLALVSELDAATRRGYEKHPAAGEPSPSEPPPPGTLMCVSVGPFATRPGAEDAAVSLQASGVVIEVHEEPGQLRTGYWVHLPPLPSREAAETVASDLQAKGAGDLFIVAAAEQRHAISLGLFASPERADQRAAEIGKLGYRPRIAERFRDGPLFWLQYREPAELAMDLSGLLAKADPEVHRRAQPCP
jgi:hypothetical protein